MRNRHPTFITPGLLLTVVGLVALALVSAAIAIQGWPGVRLVKSPPPVARSLQARAGERVRLPGRTPAPVRHHRAAGPVRVARAPVVHHRVRRHPRAVQASATPRAVTREAPATPVKRPASTPESRPAATAEPTAAPTAAPTTPPAPAPSPARVDPLAATLQTTKDTVKQVLPPVVEKPLEQLLAPHH